MKHIARSSLLVAAFFGLDKLVALARQLLVARQFGVSPALDAFNAANNLPDLLFALISGGALSLAFIPVLTETLEKQGREALWRLFSRVANWAFLITAGIALALALLAQPLVASRLGVAPGFTADQQSLVVSLMRLNLVATLIFSISGLVISGLQAHQHFLLPAMAPVLYNLGMIFGVLVLAPSQPHHLGPLALPALGLGIHGLVYGVILGACLHLAVQLPGLVRYRFHWAASLGLRDPAVWKVARLMGPRVLTLGAIQLIFVVTDNLASYLHAGSVSALVYGWAILQLPETVIGTAVGTVLLPSLAERLAQADEAGFVRALGNGVRLVLLLTLPAAVALSMLLPPLVPLVFGFDSTSSRLVALVAQMFLLGLVGQSLLELASRACYARQDARTPLAASVANFVCFLILAPLLSRGMGAAGIALANSISFTLEALLLFGWLVHRGVRFPVGGALLRAVLAASGAGAGLVLWGLLPLGVWPQLTGGLALSALVTLPVIAPGLKAWRQAS